MRLKKKSIPTYGQWEERKRLLVQKFAHERDY